MIRFLEARSKWFVVLAWVICVVGGIFGALLLMATGISMTYGPMFDPAGFAKTEPLVRFQRVSGMVMIGLGLMVAAASTILFSVNYRRTASLVVVGPWVVFAVLFGVGVLLLSP